MRLSAVSTSRLAWESLRADLTVASPLICSATLTTGAPKARAGFFLDRMRSMCLAMEPAALFRPSVRSDAVCPESARGRADEEAGECSLQGQMAGRLR